MKKINLREVSDRLSENEMKDVKGGGQDVPTEGQLGDDGDAKPCDDKKEYQCCYANGRRGVCRYMPFNKGLVCQLDQPCQ